MKVNNNLETEGSQKNVQVKPGDRETLQRQLDNYLVWAAVLKTQIDLGITPVQMGLVRPVDSI